jgi:hypothetical protein
LTPMGAGGTGSLGTQDVINVTLRSMAAGSIEKDPVTKKLPANFQVCYFVYEHMFMKLNCVFQLILDVNVLQHISLSLSIGKLKMEICRLEN